MTALEKIKRERVQQNAKWGVQNHTDEWWYPILGEEFGELGKAMLDYHFNEEADEEIEKELVQVAAVAVAWLECIERRRCVAKIFRDHERRGSDG